MRVKNGLYCQSYLSHAIYFVQILTHCNLLFASIPKATIIPSTSVISGFFLSVSFLSFANSFNTMPIWIPLRPDIRELQTSRLCGHDAIPKLSVSLSLLLAIRRFMVLHPLSSITWFIILSQHSTSTPPLRQRLTNVHGRLYPFTRLVPCISFFIFRSLELLI